MRLIAPALVALCLAGSAAADEAARLTVTGEGLAESVPDMATLSLGVTHEDKTAAAALARVSTDLAAVLAQLRAAGIEERDLQTGTLSVAPLWSGYDSGTRPRITGYSASNSLNVRVRGIERVGAVLDQVAGAGANTLQGVSFGLETPQPVQDAARRAAVADAQRKAQLYAEAAGLTLGPVLSISEPETFAPGPMPMAAPRMASEGVPVAPGEVSLSAAVTMVYALGK